MSFHICNYVSTQKTLLQWSAANLKISYIGIYIVKNYVFLVYLPLFFPYFWISIHHIECPEGPNIPIIQQLPIQTQTFLNFVWILAATTVVRHTFKRVFLTESSWKQTTNFQSKIFLKEFYIAQKPFLGKFVSQPVSRSGRLLKKTPTQMDVASRRPYYVGWVTRCK